MANQLNAVVDLSHFNGTPDFVKAKAAGIAAVIHKATEGLSYVDPMYATNRKAAGDAGLLWGAYHFGVGADGAQQADHFLNTAKPEAGTLLVLDYEPNPQGATMTLEQARDFVAHVHLVVNRFPGLYSGSLIKEQLGNVQTPDPLLSQCFLWVSQYPPSDTPQPTRIPPTWSTWTLWQYTDGMHGPEPRSVDGIGFCDRDKFNGDYGQLRKLWGVD